MSDLVEPLAAPRLHAFAAGDKTRAFRAARRHSRWVRLLRLGTMGGAVALLGGIVVFTVVDPFHPGIGAVSIEGASLSGTKVTMASPRLSGYRKDGRPYTVTAAAAVQDVKAPTLFELHDLKADLADADKSRTTVTAATGLYNSASETMDLTSAVRIVGASGLEVHAQDAQVSFKTNAVFTDKPVTVAMHNGTVAADRMQAVDGGRHVTFEGNVHSVMLPEADKADAAEPAPAAAGTRPTADAAGSAP